MPLKTQLQPHQQKAVQRALLNDIIFAHSTGSGKTLTSLAAIDAIGKPALVLTPASLVDNYYKQIQKHLDKKNRPKIRVMSLPTAASRGIKIAPGQTLILDQVHNLRNQGKRHTYARNLVRDAGRVIGLTATPSYNKAQQLVNLVNLINKDTVMQPQLFRKDHIKQRQIKDWLRRTISKVPYIADKQGLRNRLAKYLDIVNIQRQKPEVEQAIIEVPMDQQQNKVYLTAYNQMPRYIRKLIRKNLPPLKRDAAIMNAFLTAVRQISNTPQQYQQKGKTKGPKILAAVASLLQKKQKDPNFRGFVYSNYLKSGLQKYQRQLEDRGVPYTKITGQMTRKQKAQAVRAYNSGQIPIMIGSGSASQGLDLKGTKLIQILQPHWNKSRIDQVIGRGVRYKSHEHLPPEQRKVLVQKYISTLPYKRTRQQSVDQYLTQMSSDKQKLIKELKDALQ